MGLFEDLRGGVLGGQIEFPTTVAPLRATPGSFEFLGPRTDVGWWVFFFPDVTLDPSDGGWPTLRRDVARQTRILFERTFKMGNVSPARLSRGPRTRDATWSPVVEFERVSIEGGTALFVLHRMTYEPGSETLMGHFLIPCPTGLVEVRWFTVTIGPTGMRESFGTMKARAAVSPDGSYRGPGQAVFDDPALDATFPDHPLSAAREARRWLAKEVRMRVLLPPVLRPEATPIDMPEVGYSLVPPPRFGMPQMFSGPRGRPLVSMNRASFSGSDGVDLFYVHVLPLPLRLRWDSTGELLATEVEKIAREVYVEAEVQRITSTILARGNVGGERSAGVLVEGDGHLGPLRMVVHGTAREGRIVSLCLTMTATLSAEEMLAELNASARTIRRL